MRASIGKTVLPPDVFDIGFTRTALLSWIMLPRSEICHRNHLDACKPLQGSMSFTPDDLCPAWAVPLFDVRIASGRSGAVAWGIGVSSTKDALFASSAEHRSDTFAGSKLCLCSVSDSIEMVQSMITISSKMTNIKTSGDYEKAALAATEVVLARRFVCEMIERMHLNWSASMRLAQAPGHVIASWLVKDEERLLYPNFEQQCRAEEVEKKMAMQAFEMVLNEEKQRKI